MNKTRNTVLKAIFAICLLQIHILTTAQEPLRGEKPKIDTSYIQSYYGDLTLGLSIPRKYVDFSLNDIQNDQDLEYQPNSNISVGIKGAYKWLGLSVGFGLPHTSENIDRYGKTDRFDLQLNAYLRKFVVDGYLQYYQGFYLNNMDNYFDNFDQNEMNYYQRPDLTFANVGISARYIWNYNKFSYKAAYDFNEKQKKGSGSLVTGIFGFVNGASADSLVVPAFVRDEFSDQALFSNVSSINLGISVGYIYTFVIAKHFFITAGVVPGLGLQAYSAIDTEENTVLSKGGLGISTTSRIALGYNKKRFYMAFTGVSGSSNLINKDITAINFGYGNVRFTVGYRFNVKKQKEL